MTECFDTYILLRDKMLGVYLGDNENASEIVMKRISKTKNVLKRLYTNLKRYQKEEMFQTTEVSIIFEEANILFDKIIGLEVAIKNNTIDISTCVNELQIIVNKISSFMKTNGSMNLYDMITTCFGVEYLDNMDDEKLKWFKLFNSHFNPTGYKIVLWSLINRKNKNTKNAGFFEDIHIAENASTMEVYPIIKFNSEPIIYKVHGGKVVFVNEALEQTMIVYGYFEDVPINFTSNAFLRSKMLTIKENIPSTGDFESKSFDIFMSSLSLRDILIYDQSTIYDIFVGYKTFVKQMNNKPLSKITREFMNYEPLEKRSTLIKLLIHNDDFELQFMAYLLYDLLTLDDKSGVSAEQTMILESLPHIIRENFKGAMKQTIEYTNKLTNGEVKDNLPYEQRICLLKTSEYVKEKAMNKLKELKAKSEDSGSKARQYIDGLLRVPFGIYRQEPILDLMKDNKKIFIRYMDKMKNTIEIVNGSSESNNGMEIINHINKKQQFCNEFHAVECKELINNIVVGIKKRGEYLEIMEIINCICDDMGINKIDFSKYSNKIELKNVLNAYISENIDNHELVKQVLSQQQIKEVVFKYEFPNELVKIRENRDNVKDFLKDINKTLDKSVHGHSNAKKQIERIVGQWVNGDSDGYCFGFEGPPGVGKTSLAKHGLANCLKDNNGEPRPFSLIAIGGSSNGSTLDGHNYTYVGSMWGKIVDILMETKCMNPIIFIDEIDKVSRTETGREIIGILTHLIDPTQNDTFQDKYFTGIDLDLSKVLFVFSYNDVSLMDRVLLDRIHRIKFDHLSLEDKVTICEEYMLPEIYQKMGQTSNIIIPHEVIEYIVDEYTCEAGVRKMKEIMFEIVGEINLEFLKMDSNIPCPYTLSKDDLQSKYLKNREMIKAKKVHTKSRVGIMNGLWANALGRGGVIPIEANFVISGTLLDLKLTGMQGDVMKESMNVARTLAWSLTSSDRKAELVKEFEKTKTQGVHIHCPDGATPKDGPSAGTAITVTLYSLLNDRKIKNTIAITGEMSLQGDVTAIGGLDLKIIGGIQAGVKTFLFPEENVKDFKKFMEKYSENPIVEGIQFIPISRIEEALEHAMEDE